MGRLAGMATSDAQPAPDRPEVTLLPRRQSPRKARVDREGNATSTGPRRSRSASDGSLFADPGPWLCRLCRAGQELRLSRRAAALRRRDAVRARPARLPRLGQHDGAAHNRAGPQRGPADGLGPAADAARHRSLRGRRAARRGRRALWRLRLHRRGAAGGAPDPHRPDHGLFPDPCAGADPDRDRPLFDRALLLRLDSEAARPECRDHLGALGRTRRASVRRARARPGRSVQGQPKLARRRARRSPAHRQPEPRRHAGPAAPPGSGHDPDRPDWPPRNHHRRPHGRDAPGRRRRSRDRPAAGRATDQRSRRGRESRQRRRIERGQQSRRDQAMAAGLVAGHSQLHHPRPLFLDRQGLRHEPGRGGRLCRRPRTWRADGAQPP